MFLPLWPQNRVRVLDHDPSTLIDHELSRVSQRVTGPGPEHREKRCFDLVQLVLGPDECVNQGGRTMPSQARSGHRTAQHQPVVVPQSDPFGQIERHIVHLKGPVEQLLAEAREHLFAEPSKRVPSEEQPRWAERHDRC